MKPQQASKAGAHPEVIEGDRGVMGKQRAELVQACQHHEGAAVVLGSKGHDMGPHGCHDAAICQHCVCTHQDLHHMTSQCDPYCFSTNWCKKLSMPGMIQTCCRQVESALLGMCAMQLDCVHCSVSSNTSARAAHPHTQRQEVQTRCPA